MMSMDMDKVMPISLALWKGLFSWGAFDFLVLFMSIMLIVSVILACVFAVVMLIAGLNECYSKGKTGEK